MKIEAKIETRLDKIHTGISRSRFQKLIKGGEVRVNGKVEKVAHLLLSPGDEVTLPDIKEEEVAFIPGINSEHFAQFARLYEDDAMMIINKPAGIRVEAIIPVELREQLFLAHRLDKDTSGALVIAKGSKALLSLQAQWKKRSVEKTYLALVKGKMATPTGKIQAAITRSPQDRTKMSVSSKLNARAADTDYKMLQYFPTSDVTLLEAYPHTGRTHQIRVHFTAIGHPIIGDEKYGDHDFNKEFTEALGLKRQFLHAQFLSLNSPITNEQIKIEAPIPDDLQNVLKQTIL